MYILRIFWLIQKTFQKRQDFVSRISANANGSEGMKNLKKRVEVTSTPLNNERKKAASRLLKQTLNPLIPIH
jgi:hypothetical protein